MFHKKRKNTTSQKASKTAKFLKRYKRSILYDDRVYYEIVTDFEDDLLDESNKNKSIIEDLKQDILNNKKGS